MKKKNSNKKILVLALLLLVVGVGTYTYANYKSTATGTGKATVANWAITVNETDITTTETFTLSDINWTTNDYVTSGKIAPGSEGYVEVNVDATGSEVAMQLTFSVGALTDSSGGSVTNTNIAVSKVVEVVDGQESEITGSSATAVIGLSDTKTKTYRVYVTWTAVDEDTQNATDTAMGADPTTINVPVTVTATQYFG